MTRLRRAVLAGLLALAATTAVLAAPSSSASADDSARAAPDASAPGSGDVLPASPTPASPADSPPAAAAPEDPSAPVPPPSAKARRYYRSGNLLWIVGVTWSLLVPAVLLFTGWAARLRDLARRLGRSWLGTVVGFFLLYTLVTTLLDLPFAFYAGFLRQHAYDLSNQTLGKWASDAMKGLAVGLVGGSLVVWMPYLLLRKSPRRWWLYTGIAALPFYLLVMLVSPVWIAPLFNDFGPMRDAALESRILALAERSGVEAERVFEVRKSVDTKRVNAYVAGIANTQRIVLWDTLVDRLDEDEVLLVMGHELGHYVLGHVFRGILLFSAGTLVALWLAHRLAGSLLRRWGGRFGFSSLADPASLPLLILLFNVFGLAAAPAALAYSRWQEHEADRFGLEITRDNDACAGAFRELMAQNLSYPYPGPVYKLFRASHPPIGERVEFCRAYRPWETGEPLRYGELFAGPDGS